MSFDWNIGALALARMAEYPVASTLAILAVAIALVALAHFLVRSLNEGRYAWERSLRERLGVAEGKPIGELRWLLITLHFFLWQFVVYLLLYVWGLHDASERFLHALFSSGVSIGGANIVVGKFIAGLMVFIVLFTFTRWLRRKLEQDWLVRAGVEFSTRDTMATLFGYITFVIAALVGVSYAGLDLSKLAIVAGALSVGIGFGLQNIVSNFVSGLILLFERPVRTGDYISVSGAEGVVRKMRIRATEIETSDRETIIMPNSNLLSNPVKNRKLRTRQGRAVLQVGVSYGSDPEQVRDLLLKIAAGHKRTLKSPGPSVTFTNFGASSLDFELVVPVDDADAKGRVASDLRFAIVKAFREADIEMPFPQQDVYLRAVPDGLLASPPQD